MDLATVDEHAPGVGVMESEGDAHERRLAGPVLADDRVDLAGSQVDGDVVVGDDPGIGLGDALEAQEGRRSAGVQRCRRPIHGRDAR